MQCRFCLLQNPGTEDRCQRCGRPLDGDVTFDGMNMAGATALAPQVKFRETNDEISAQNRPAPPGPSRAARPSSPAAERQPFLFNGLFSGDASSNVIPFDSIRSSAASPARWEPQHTAAAVAPAKQPANAKQVIRKQSASRSAGESQGLLDLEFLPPAAQTPRTLKTTVEASIYCDAPVAAPMHRSVAAFLDSAMILGGCGAFLAIFQLFGGGVRLDRFDLTIFAIAALLITMFYGFLFAWSGRETAGQRWTELRLINFDGFSPDSGSRALRFAGCWLSCCAGGVGLLWALLDEENLTWHDHMSKTFLTMREADSSFCRERPR